MTPAPGTSIVVDDEEDTCHNLSHILTDLGTGWTPPPTARRRWR